MREISSFSIIFKGNSNQFLDQDMVDKLLKQNKPDEFRLKKNILDLDSIEKVFKDILAIKNVNIYSEPIGRLGVEIEERIPVVRIIDKIKNYYLDEGGYVIPFSEKYSPRVPLFFGKLNESDKLFLIRFLNIILKNEFIRNELVEVGYLNKNFSIRLRSYDFEIEWGPPIKFENKIFKLNKFCKYITAENKIKSYKKINITYNNQVIATQS